MLGNDIVDLAFAYRQSNWRRRNYLSKIYSFEEQETILNAANPDLMVWIFWSMKEAAYKIINRFTGNRFYCPLAFKCTFSLNGEVAVGKVSFQDDVLISKTIITDQYIHTSVIQQHLSFNDIGIIFLKNQKEYLSDFNAAQNDLILSKDCRGLPEISTFGKHNKCMASISHHGAFLSLAYLK